MANIADLVVTLRAQTTQFQAGMAGAQTTLGSFNAAAAGTTASTSKMTGALAKVKPVASLAFAAAGIAVAKFAIDAAKAASDQEEALNKVNVVFERSSRVVTDFAETSATAAGISRTAALEASAGFGQMLQTAGLAADASADMSVALVKLAADLASFNNIDPTEALEKLRSGLAGEAEPLRVLGVFLSEARVQAEAFSSGIAKTGAELTEAQKVQARYNLILQDTTKAQGDFARTADSAANQQRTLAAEFENMKAEVGQALLPVMKDLLGIVRDLLPALKLLGQGIGLVGKAISPVIGLLDGMNEEMREFNDLISEAADVSPEFARQAEELNNGLQAVGKGGAIAATALRVQADRTLDSIAAAESADVALKLMGDRFEQAAESTRDLAGAQRQGAAATQELITVQNILAGGALGLVASIDQAAEAQREVNRLRRRGKADTQAFRDAELTLLNAQLNVRAASEDLAEQMKAEGASARDVRRALIRLGREAGLTAKEARALAREIQGIANKQDAVDPVIKTRVTADTSQAREALNTLLGMLRDLSGGAAIAVRAGINATQVPQVATGGFVAQSGLAVIHKGEEITPAGTRMRKIEINLGRERFARQLAYDHDYRGW